LPDVHEEVKRNFIIVERTKGGLGSALK
jgi:hypothetical protein